MAPGEETYHEPEEKTNNHETSDHNTDTYGHLILYLRQIQ
jgi:hypothetical protein